MSKLADAYRQETDFEIPKLSFPRKRESINGSRRGFPIKDFGNDTVAANLDSNDNKQLSKHETKVFVICILFVIWNLYIGIYKK